MGTKCLKRVKIEITVLIITILEFFLECKFSKPRALSADQKLPVLPGSAYSPPCGFY